ncbi:MULTISPECIES: 4-oxalocrotonate tautomerase [unclassified Bradyrhizobium]|uniref:4-oxalocrotonate tautomerase n=1 Tax=unclassified Bradyrhizobium TaxID=2631580 RepID=UPI0028E8E1E7|nr:MULTISPECIES: 4-oxalocrotonate tautomerase [unclassified Bradyrhizobium]
MPISLTLTDGVIAADKAPIAVARITESFLRHHGLAGNRLMTANVTAHLNILPKGQTFAGGQPVDGAWIETKTPSFALASHDIQTAFFGEATDILHDLSGGTLARDRIWSNGVHAVDGSWNLNGRPMTNEALVAAVTAG